MDTVDPLHPSSRADHRIRAMAVLLATQFMVILDGTIVNVALPTIRGDLGLSDAGLAWVVNAFFVPFAVLLLPAGRLGDLVGARRVFLAGLVIFTLASLACGLASSPAVLLAARSAQGVGGALTCAVVLGMIARLYDDESGRARAFGLVAFVGAAGASIGVVAGGLLTQLASWHWVFLVNVPLGVLAVPLALRHLDDVRGPGLRGSRFLPLVPGRLLASRRFVVANGVLFTMTAAGFSFQFLSALYLQDVLGYDPLRTGLSYLTVTVAIAVTSLVVSGRLGDKYGGARVLVAGLVLFVGGLLLMARVPGDGGYLFDVAPALAVMGAGFGLAMPQATAIAMGATAADTAGVASGFVNTTQQAGGVVGLAVVAAVAAQAGLRAGFLTAALVLAVGAVCATSLVRPRPVTGREVVRGSAAPTLDRC
jgi:MFS family permease